MFRMRISEEEIVIIAKALKLLRKHHGWPIDTAEKELTLRTSERFQWIADKKERHFRRPRRQRYHKEVTEDFNKDLEAARKLEPL